MASVNGQGLTVEPTLSRVTDDESSAAALRWAVRALVSIVWISAAIFGLYIVALYAGAVSDGAPERWNESLPRLYEPYEMLATIGIGAHFMTGTILLLLGPIQLIRTGRESAPWLHRWLGPAWCTDRLVGAEGSWVA